MPKTVFSPFSTIGIAPSLFHRLNEANLRQLDNDKYVYPINLNKLLESEKVFQDSRYVPILARFGTNNVILKKN